MKRIIRLFSKTGARQFSVKNKEVAVVLDMLQSYKQDKNTLNNHFYHSIEKLYKYDAMIKEKVNYLASMPSTVGATSISLNSDIIREYLRIRKEIGFSEELVAGLLRTLASQKHRNYDYNSLKADIWGKSMNLSPLFRLVIDDVKLLAYDKMEVDLEQLTSIFHSLTTLDYKEPELTRKLLDKIIFMIKNPRVTLNELGDSKKEQLLEKNLQNYSTLVEKNVFKDMLTDILQVKSEPQRATTVFSEIKALERQEVEDLDLLFERMETILDHYKSLNIEFLNTILAIRSYYFDLRQDQKLEIMKKYPEIYLDFLRMENSLIQCGILMPKDLIENASPEDQESLALLMEQILLEIGADPALLTQMMQISPKVVQKEGFDPRSTLLIENGQTQGGVQIAPFIKAVVSSEDTNISANDSFFYSRVIEALDSIVDNMRARVSCLDEKDNYRFDGFRHAFKDTLDSTIELARKKFGKIIDDPNDFFTVVDQEKTSLGYFYYGKVFDICHDVLENFHKLLLTKIRDNADTCEADLLNVEGCLRLDVLGQKALNADLSQFAKTKLTVQRAKAEPITLEAMQVLVNNLEFVSKDIFADIIKLAGVKNLAKPAFVAEFINSNRPLSEQINAAFFFYTLIRLSGDSQSEQALKEAIFRFATHTNLADIYFFKYRKEIPLSYEYSKLFYVFQFIKKYQNDYAKANVIENMIDFEKARIKVKSYLDIDFEFTLRGDPVFAMIFNQLVETNPQVAENLQDMHRLLDVPFAILPTVISKTQQATNCFILNFPSEDETSIASEIRRDFITWRIPNAQVTIKNVRDFFADKLYYINMNFQFAEDLDHTLKQTLHIEKQVTGEEGQLLTSVFELLKVQENDSLVIQKKKKHYLKTFMTLENTVKNAQEMESTKMSVIRKALIFYSHALLNSFKGELSQNQIAEISRLTSAIKSRIPSDQKGETAFPYSFHGKRFSFDRPDSLLILNDYREFLNYKTFSEPGYFLFRDWQIELEEYLDPMQLSQSADCFYNKNVKMNKTLLPCIDGRQLSRPSFQYVWEELVYTTNKDQKQKIVAYETIASLNNFAKISPENKWKVALMNFTYEFKAKADLPSQLKKLLQCDFWNVLLDEFARSIQDDPQSADQGVSDSKLFNLENIAYYLDTRIRPRYKPTPYEDFMRSKVEIKKSLEYWKDMFDVTLPKLYSMADSDAAKDNIHKAYMNAKHKYIEAMKDYEENLAVIDSAFNINYFKDFVVHIRTGEDANYSRNNSIYLPRNALLKDAAELERLTKNSLLKQLIIYKEQQGHELSQKEKLFKDSWKKAVAEQGADNVFVYSALSNLKIRDAFSEKDILFFERNFIHSKIESFTDQKLSDFLTILNLMFNPEIIAVEEGRLFVESHLPAVADGTLKLDSKQLADFIACPIANSSRFDLDYSLNKIWFNSSRVTEKEKAIIKDMLSIYKSIIIRIRQGRRKVAWQGLRGL